MQAPKLAAIIASYAPSRIAGRRTPMLFKMAKSKGRLFVRAIAVAIFLVGSLSSIAYADKLPKGAIPLTSDEVTKIYSGATVDNGMSKIYFDPAGTLEGVYGKPPKGAFKGTWSVTGNESCMYPDHGDGKPHPNCNKFWIVGKKIWALWTVHDDGSAVDTKNGYNSNEVQKYKSGNSITAIYAKLSAQ